MKRTPIKCIYVYLAGINYVHASIYDDLGRKDRPILHDAYMIHPSFRISGDFSYETICHYASRLTTKSDGDFKCS